jgi:hypothetical protein
MTTVTFDPTPSGADGSIAIANPVSKQACDREPKS